MSSRPEPTEYCQHPEKCPTGAVPGEAGCLRWRSCINRQNRRTHGLSGEPEYPAWKGMRRRVKRRDYRTYGIAMDPEWKNHPGPFIAYVRAYLPPFRPGDTLDRVDNDLGYVPGNVTWATRAEQAQNRGHEEGARELGWSRSAPCLCDQRMRQVCPCEPAKLYRAGSVAERDEADWPPCGDRVAPGPAVIEVADVVGATFLGSLFGELRRDQDGVAWVLKRSLTFRPGIGPDGLQHVEEQRDGDGDDDMGDLLGVGPG